MNAGGPLEKSIVPHLSVIEFIATNIIQLLFGKEKYMVKNIAAYTAPGCNFPEFISINNHEKGVSIIFRGPVKAEMNGWVKPGETIEIIMTDGDFAKLLTDAVVRFPSSTAEDPNQSKLDV